MYNARRIPTRTRANIVQNLRACDTLKYELKYDQNGSPRHAESNQSFVGKSHFNSCLILILNVFFSKGLDRGQRDLLPPPQ